MSKFTDLLASRILLFDGGFGSMLMRSGVKPGACPELLNIENPDAVYAIHKAYADIGCDAVETNTLGANAIALGRHGLADKTAQINEAAVKLVRKAIGEERIVALSVGPTGGFLSPMGALGVDEVYAAYREQAVAGANAGADVIYIETMGDIAEARLAAIAAKENTDLPIVMSFTFSAGRMLTGGTPEAAAMAAQALGCAACAVNCSGGPDELYDVLVKMRAVTSLPVIVQPNAGLPISEGGKTIYPLSPEDMAPKMAKILSGGASAIGGCCGTTPEHITAMRPLLEGCEKPALSPLPTLPTNTRQVFALPEGEAVQLESDPDALYDVDPDAPAALLNADLFDEDALEDFIGELLSILSLPLIIDGKDEKKRARALLCYPGVALTHEKSLYGAIEI